jgi:fructose-bisphosphate aldolase class II
LGCLLAPFGGCFPVSFYVFTQGFKKRACRPSKTGAFDAVLAVLRKRMDSQGKLCHDEPYCFTSTLSFMPVATPEQFRQMIRAAQSANYALPAVNCASLVAINAALKGFADSGSDGIIQFSTGAGEFASGLNAKNSALGAIVLAELVHRLASQYGVLVALHTDHCPPEKAASFLNPLIEATAQRRHQGQGNLFNGHMLDASHLPLTENLRWCKEYLALCQPHELVLEVEAGVVGGEEDGASGSDSTPHHKLYTTPEDMQQVYEALQGQGAYLLAATFGNVHGHYKPGAVQLRPDILKQGQAAVMRAYGPAAELDLVFHGGSGTPTEQIRETLAYGVVKMNLDTDAQYAFTRSVADHVLKHYDSVLKVDGEIGNKKHYDPRSYLKKAEASMAQRVAQACEDLCSQGKTLFGQV